MFAERPSTRLGNGWLTTQLGSGLVQAVHHGGYQAAVGADLVETARHVADELEGRLSGIDGSEISAAQELISRLGADSRLIAFFTEGLTSLGSQAIAQFAGWNIPGVGEGYQKFRPRTRLYDTLDPDTIAQVRETLAYERTSFVFIPCTRVHQSSARAWADVLVPRIEQKLGPVAAQQQIAEVLHGQRRRILRADDAKTLTVSDSASLLIPSALVGFARGLDGRALVRGALDAVNAKRAAIDHDPEAALAWIGLLTAKGANAKPQMAEPLFVPLSDRLARFSAWGAAVYNAHGGFQVRADVASQAVSGLSATQIGLSPHLPRVIEFQLVLPPEIPDHAIVERAVAAQQGLVELAVDRGHPARLLEAADYSAESYGALFASIMLDAMLLNSSKSGQLGIPRD